MTHRFFVDEPIQGDQAELAGGEAHHALHVMRLAVGDETTLFDGSGAEFPARVTELSRSTVSLLILDRVVVDRELSFRLSVGVALPKGDRQRWLVEKLVELGISDLTPLSTRRGVSQPTEKAVQRLQRTVVDASKQCGRNQLMTVHPATSLHEFVESFPPGLRLLADPVGQPWHGLPPETGDASLVIGPEGGLTASETAAAFEAGWRAVSLGKRILRIETAALLAAGLLAARDL